MSNFSHLKLSEKNGPLRKSLREALVQTYFSHMTWWKDVLSPQEEKSIEDHVSKRYNLGIDYVLPWIDGSISLKGKTIVEIGCGTGSSTVAIAQVAQHVHAYDINGRAVAAAKERAKLFNCLNVSCYQHPPEKIIEGLQSTHEPASCDVVLLYAVLEHQTVAERVETLKLAWSLLRPGGAIVIVETPNRLSYVDHHTSLLPFYHMLPLELQKLYFDRSPRVDFVQNMKAKVGVMSEKEFENHQIRWGQSVSYHEFEIALGDFKNNVIADGYSPYMVSLRPLKPEETHLKNFFEKTKLDVPIGFSRYYLDLIIQKPMQM